MHSNPLPRESKNIQRYLFRRNTLQVETKCIQLAHDKKLSTDRINCQNAGTFHPSKLDRGLARLGQIII